jgi:hypothetical protein
MLRVMVLQKTTALSDGMSPTRRPKTDFRGPSGFSCEMCCPPMRKLVADADEYEFCNVRRAA